TTACAPAAMCRRPIMRELDKELKELRLYGMAGAWEDLVKQGGHATLESSRWLLEHLLEAEATDRAMRSISYQRRHGVHRAGAQRGVGRWPGHGQDAPGHGHRRGGHHPSRLAGAFL